MGGGGVEGLLTLGFGGMARFDVFNGVCVNLAFFSVACCNH